jgi:hypothetical protein
MAGFSTYLETAILNWVRGSAFPTAPSAVYVALFTVAPADAGTGGTEVSGNGYARTAVTFATPVSATPSSGTKTLSNATATFPAATASWGTVVAFAFYDASSGGNMLASGTLTTSLAVATGNQVNFSAGSLQLLSD